MKMLHVVAFGLLAAASPTAHALCDGTGAAEIERDYDLKQCLARKFTLDGVTKTLYIPMPVQNERENFATACDVALSPIGAAGDCAKKVKLKDLKLRIHYDNGSEKYWVTLIQKNGTKLLDSVKTTFRQGPVDYLEYWDEGERLTYFIYLADLDPGAARQKKFYWVEVFDDRDKKAECKAERPPYAFVSWQACHSRTSAEGIVVDPFIKLGTRQTDTGGGFEPPK